MQAAEGSQKRNGTTLPGYPQEYLDGLLPPIQIDADKFPPIDNPMYNWRDLNNLGFEQTQKDHVFTPIDPASMYVSCHSWVSYPYGIPDEDQPCPYAQVAQTPQSAHRTDTITSLTTESEPHYSPQAPVFEQRNEEISEPAPQQPPVVHVTESLLWTG